MLSARFLLLLTVTIWGWTFVATKVALDHMSPVELMGLRFLVAIPVLLALSAVRRAPIRAPRRTGRVLLGSFLFGLHFFVQIHGLRFTTAVSTGWLIAMSPLVVALLAFLVLGEPMGRRTLLGIAVATSGILLLVSRGRLGSLGWLSSVGDWLIVASAHTWALFTIATRDLSRSEDPLTVTLSILIPVAAVVLAVMAFRSNWASLLAMPVEVAAAVLFLGILGTALGQWLWQIGIAKVGAAEAGLFLYLEPLATTALAVPFLGEPLSATTVAGGLLVLAGVRFATAGRRLPRPPP